MEALRAALLRRVTEAIVKGIGHRRGTRDQGNTMGEDKERIEMVYKGWHRAEGGKKTQASAVLRWLVSRFGHGTNGGL